MIEDYDLIEASFAKQYGIRLRNEPDMTWGEFATLLSGIMPDTPLGNIVSIRSEKNPDMLKNFTNEQKKIRSEWARRNVKEISNKDYDKAINNLESIFRAMAKK